ncbi:MAG: dihydrofolate reductase [Melioribacteraceae bacterium]|nr:dihydrofolate reductase [Melioribacteraceae bacterium]
MEKIIISAVSQNNVIGRNGKLPWHIPEELQFFKKTTLKHAVLMGRKTYDSIGQPLPQRLNIILTQSSAHSDFESLIFTNSIQDAFDISLSKKHKKCFIIGGESIFNQTLELCDRIIISRIPDKFEGDTYFPKIETELWNLTEMINYEKFNVEHYKKCN